MRVFILLHVRVYEKTTQDPSLIVINLASNTRIRRYITRIPLHWRLIHTHTLCTPMRKVKNRNIYYINEVHIETLICAHVYVDYY